MKAQHPIVSCVLYLNSESGGPTVVTDQTLGGHLAKRAWLCFPKTNRLVAFDARYLHGDETRNLLHIFIVLHRCRAWSS